MTGPLVLLVAIGLPVCFVLLDCLAIALLVEIRRADRRDQ